MWDDRSKATQVTCPLYLLGLFAQYVTGRRQVPVPIRFPALPHIALIQLLDKEAFV